MGIGNIGIDSISTLATLILVRSYSLHPAAKRWLFVCAMLAAGEYCAFKIFSLGPLWPVAFVLAVFTVLLGYAFAVPFWLEAGVFLLGLGLGMIAAAERYAMTSAFCLHPVGRPPIVKLFVEEDAAEKITKAGKRSVSFNSSCKGVKLKVVGYIAEGETPPKAGETWIFSGMIQPAKQEESMQRRTVFASGRNSRFERCNGPEAMPFRIKRFAKRMRKNLSTRLGVGMCGEYPETALARAMFLGERGGISQREKEMFISAGVFHVFAISGLHVAIVAKVLMFFSAFLGCTRRWAGLVVIPAIWGYVAMTGLLPSAMRAAIMASGYFIAPMIWRSPDILKAWVLTFIATHIATPALIMDIGANYSFAVMLSIALYLDLAARFEVSGWKAALGISFMAWAAGVPISARNFGRFTPGGLIASPLVIPLASAAVVCESLGILASFISHRLAGMLNVITARIINMMTSLSGLVASLPLSDFKVRNWSLGECAAWYFVVSASAWLVMHITKRRRENWWM